MTYTERFSERVVPIAYFQPGQRNPQTEASEWINVENYHRLVAVIQIGAMGALGTFTVTLREATDGGGTNAATIGGKTVTFTQAGGDANQAPSVIEVRGEELSNDGVGKYEYVQLQAVTAVNNVDYSIILYGVPQRFLPTATTSWNSITD
jgi:hypothetical protein